MSKLNYKLDIFFTKLQVKLKESKILNNKYFFIFIVLLFIFLAWTYYYSINNHYWFQRWFEQNIFRIKNIENKILILLSITGIFIALFLVKYLNFQNFSKKVLNLFTLNILIYIWLVFLFIQELKYQILAIITPIVFYIVYKIYDYIEDTKEKYKHKFLFDSRYFFLIALFLLIYTPIFIYFKDQKIAENLSIYAYYALIFWVVYEIILYRFKK